MNLLDLLKRNNPELVNDLKSKNVDLSRDNKDRYIARNEKDSRVDNVYWMSDKAKERYKTEQGFEDVDFYHRFINWVKGVINYHSY